MHLKEVAIPILGSVANLFVMITVRVGAFGRPLEGEPVKEDSPQQACRDLGGYLIACMFKEQKTTRTDIIEEILNRVITKSTSPIHHFIGRPYAYAA